VRKIVALAMFAALLGHAGPGHALGSFTTFETGQVRPLALTPDGTKLLAINTPDARLEIFDVDGNGDLSQAATVPVGMDPIAVAARNDDEAWVLNHLSDSVSIVDLASTPPRRAHAARR
jgi:DNA-binding beta-propeller fold protein YncE